jgi:GntR family transcriptional regulator
MPEANGNPVSEDVRQALLDHISSGKLKAGQRLGSERDLATELRVSRSSLRQALALLEQTGAVRRVPGRGGGTFVSQPKIERDLSHVVGVPALLRAQGFTAGTRVVSTGLTAAGEATARELGIGSNELVFDIVRLRLADGIPISLEHARFPAARFPGLLERSLGGSMYEMLESDYGVRPCDATERIEVVIGAEHEVSILEVEPKAPLMSITRTTEDESGVPFEFSHDLFRADRTRIVVHSSNAGSTTDRRNGCALVEVTALTRA